MIASYLHCDDPSHSIHAHDLHPAVWFALSRTRPRLQVLVNVPTHGAVIVAGNPDLADRISALLEPVRGRPHPRLDRRDPVTVAGPGPGHPCTAHAPPTGGADVIRLIARGLAAGGALLVAASAVNLVWVIR